MKISCKPSYVLIWEKAHGEVPIEPNGKRYHIHHINGDHNDNRLENLIALTNSEHARIHGLKGDTGIKELLKSVEERLKNKTHPCFDPEIGSLGAHARNKIHGNPAHKPESIKKTKATKLFNGTDQRTLVEKGVHNFIVDHPAKWKYKCTKTGRVNTMTAFKRWYKDSLNFLERIY